MDEDALIVEPKLVGRGQLVSQGLCLLSSLDPSRNELALALGAAEGDRKGKKVRTIAILSL